MPSLESAYAQVTRGGEHLAELKVLHDEVAAEQAKSTVVEFQAEERAIDPGETVEAGQVRYPNPVISIRIRIIAGETANCFRSALDYMVGQLAILDCGTRQERTQFPIADTPKQFKEARRCSLKGVSNAHVAAIEKLQPFNGCGWARFLAILSNFAKHDDLILLKHGVLITTEKYTLDAFKPEFKV